MQPSLLIQKKGPGPRPLHFRILFWIALIGVAAFLRLPSFTEAVFDPDIGTVLYGARIWPGSGCLYPDIVETKPPGSHFLLALLLLITDSLTMLNVLVALYHMCVAFVLGRLVAHLDTLRAGRWAALLYVVFSASGFVNGLAPNYETWTLLPLVSAALSVERAGQTQKLTWFALAGLGLGLAVLMKQPAVLVAGALAVPLVIAARNLPARRKMAAALALFVSGLVVPWAATFLFFASRGCLGVLYQALAPGRSLSYTVSNEPAAIVRRAMETFGMFTWHNGFLIVGGLVGLGLLVFRSQRRSMFLLLGPWLLGSVLAVWAGTKFFSHYFFYLVPPLSAIAGYGVASVASLPGSKRNRMAAVAACGALLLLSMRNEARFSLLAARNLAFDGQVYSRDLFRLNASLGPRWLDYCLPYNHLEWELYAQEAGRYLRERTDPPETILVFDYLPSIYWYAGRSCPTGHHANFEVTFQLPEEYGKWHRRLTSALMRNRDDMMEDLRRAPPRFIVRAASCPDTGDSERGCRHVNVYGDPMPALLWRTPLFPALQLFLETHYRPARDAPNIPLEIWAYDERTSPSP